MSKKTLEVTNENMPTIVLVGLDKDNNEHFLTNRKPGTLLESDGIEYIGQYKLVSISKLG